MRLNVDTLRREMGGPVALIGSGAAEPVRGSLQIPRRSVRHRLPRAFE
jgi:hypothetical protein